MADAKQYFIYARKSTDVEDKQVRSIDAQLFELNERATRDGISVVDVIVEKESAKTPGRRRAFNAMLDRVERGEADGILAWHPDRLARNMTDGGRVIDLIDTGKLLSLRFPSFWFEATPQGKFMLSMAFSQSKYYVDSMAENTKRGFREKIRRGEYPGWAPIGYINDRRIKRIVLDPERAPIVKQAFERYATGNETLDSIRQFLADSGIRSRTGKLLIRGAVSRFLSNPIYYGQFQYAGEIYDGIHDPIVSKHLFDEVQEVLSSRWKWSPTSVAKIPKPYLGLFRCDECGGAITAEVQKGHTYYRCTKENQILKWCFQPYVREEALDAEISRLLLPYALRPGWADEMLARLDAEEKEAAKDSGPLIAMQRKQIENIQSKIGRLIEMRIDGDIDAKIYTDRKAKLMSQRKTIEENLVEMSKGRKPWLEPLKKWVLDAKNIGIIAETGSPDDKVLMAKKVFGSNLFLSQKKPRGEAVKPWSFLTDNEYSKQLVPLLAAARTFFEETVRG